MQSYRKPSSPMGAVLLPLLVHLLFTSRIGDAASSVEKPARERVILEEVIVSGSGDNARASVDAIATDSTQINDEILSLLSKRELRRRRASRPSKADQDASQSRTVIVDVRNDEVDLERLKHAIAEYEPRRITSKKAKRKIIDGSLNATDDTARGGSGGGSATTDFQRIYHEVLRNISRAMIPQMIPSNAPAFNPYLAQKSSSQIREPEATVSDDIAKKKSPDYHVDASHVALPATLTLKKTKKKLAKKYPQASHHIAAASRLGSEGDNAGNSGSAEGHFKPNNASVVSQPPSIVYSSPPTEESSSSSHPESSTAIPSFSSAPNVSNVSNAYSTYDPSNLNIPSEYPFHLPSLSYNALPRPFSVSENVANNLDVSHRKPANFHLAERPHVARPAGSVLPLVLPTDLTPPRRYVPIKRANSSPSHGNAAKIVSSVTSPPTNSPGSTSGQPSTDYGAPYADVIGTTRSPPVTNGPDHHPTTRNPAESSASTVAAETSALTYDQQIARKNDLLPGVNTQGAKSEPNFNIGLALYNKFANMYSANAPSAVAQDYQNFQQLPSQRAPAAPYYSVSRKPNSPLLKIPPVSAVKPALAPYYDSRLLVSPSVGSGEAGIADERDNKGSERTNERVKNEDEAVDDPGKKPANDQTRLIDRDTPKRQREQEEDSEEDGASQQRPRGHRDESDERAKYESEDDDEDEEEPDETQRGQYVSSSEERESEPKRSYHYQFGKRKYDREDPEEEQRRDDKRKNHRDKADTQRNDASSERYSDARYGAESYKQSGDRRYDRKNERREKNHRQNDDRREEESVDEEEKSPIFRHAKDRDGPHRKYKKKRLDDGYKYHHHHHRETAPLRDSRREERRREEYGESNPKHVRKEYHRARDDHHHKHDDDGNDDDDHHDDHVRGETREHKHTEHHDNKKDGGDHNFEEGKGDEFEEEHQGHEGEKGHEGYKVWHEHEKADKGHHDKEHASKKYDEKDGEEKKHEEEGGYQEEHHEDEKGEKAAEFGEKGEHKKGHSTHGEHSVHKKDEYEKKTEFFDEFHEGGDVEKHGEHHHEHESKKGGHEKKGHHDAADHEEKHGKKEKHEKGGHHHEHKGHKVGEGDDHDYEHDEKYGRKKGHEHGKKWSFKKGDDGGSGDHR